MTELLVREGRQVLVNREWCLAHRRKRPAMSWQKIADLHGASPEAGGLGIRVTKAAVWNACHELDPAGGRRGVSRLPWELPAKAHDSEAAKVGRLMIDWWENGEDIGELGRHRVRRFVDNMETNLFTTTPVFAWAGDHWGYRRRKRAEKVLAKYIAYKF